MPPARAKDDMQTILVIEDERDMAELVAFNLEQEGYKSLIASDGVAGLDMVRKHNPDLVLLDLMLPRLLGTEVCKQLKKSKSTAHIPVIMVTARGEEIDKVVGFEIGADDYVVKPFSIRELILRVKVALRRSLEGRRPDSPVSIGNLTMDAARHLVEVNGEAVRFTSTEFKLLHTLVKGLGLVQRRDYLLKEVWGYDYAGDTRTVDTHITRLRTKMGAAGEMIRTVRGFGYMLE